MILGQTYNINYISYHTSADIGTKIKRKAKLIFEGKYFSTFEYKSKMGDMIRVTVDKRNKGGVQEV